MAENETLLAKYVELKRTMRKLEAEIEALNEAIYSQIEEAGWRKSKVPPTSSPSDLTKFWEGLWDRDECLTRIIGCLGFPADFLLWFHVCSQMSH